MKTLNSKVNPPVEYETDGIILSEGLDLTTSNLQIDKGALRDCLNFEVIDRLGYQTVAGFDRYDGSISPDQPEFWVFPTTGGLPDPGEVLISTSAPFIRYGVVVGSLAVGSVEPGFTFYTVYARFNASDSIVSGQDVSVVGVGVTPTYTATGDAVRYTGSAGQDGGDTAVEIYDQFQDWNDVLRARVGALPGQPIGLHWFRDKAYAVADHIVAGFNSGGTVEIKPNDILRRSTFACRVLEVTLASGTWAGGDAAGTFLVQPILFFNGVSNAINRTVPTSGDYELLNTVPVSGNWSSGSIVISSNIATARALTASDPSPSFAGLWRADREQPSVGVERGWTQLEPGWQLQYENGFSSSGDLREIERSITNNFTFGTGDESGLSQDWFNGTTTNPVLEGTTQNSPGWKDSNNPDDFAQDSVNVETEDNTTYLIGDIDFGFEVAGQPIRTGDWKSRLADSTVPLIDLPTTGTRQAGYADARAPMLFLNIGALLDALPTDAEITGFEVATKVRLGFSAGGDAFFDTVLYPSVFDLEDAIVAQTSVMFKAAAHLGNYSAEDGAFKTLGQKRTATFPLPTTRGGYTWTTSTDVTPFNHFKVEAEWDSGTNETVVVGGSTDLFGNTRLTVEEARNSDFGIILYGTTEAGLAPPVFGVPPDENLGDGRLSLVGALRTSFDEIVLKVYYTEPSARYYVREGATNKVLTFDLINHSVLSGQLINSTAAGVLQVTNIQSVNSGSDFKTCILADDVIYRDPAFSRKVADVVGTPTGAVAMSLNGLPALDAILEAGSRYQFISANFFARDEWDGFYGVSGAGKAFSFASFDADDDGDEEQYLQFITTNTIAPEEDKPRHVAAFQYHLALGYRDGTVRFSVPGEPENFDGILGASEIGVGDRVTGLLVNRGKALTVYCEKSIYTILGDSADTFSVENVSPYNGAIEYTAVDMGIPLHCDNRGISTLEQSQRYGNFVGIRLSQKVSPWLRPRMTRLDDLFSLTNAAGVVCAIPIRSKNQYRVFFRDGYVLTLTINGDQSQAFTFSRYYLDEDDSQYIVPIAHSSEVDTDGVDRVHIAHYSPRSAISDDESKFVYEFESGLGFDGSWFDAFFDTAFAYRTPFREQTVRAVRAEGLTKGYGPYTITVAKDYDTTSYSNTDVNISLPSKPALVPSGDYLPTTALANVAKEGRSLSFRIKRNENKKTLVPPTVYQALLVQYQPGGKRDA